MSDPAVPVRLTLKKDEKLEVAWQDGLLSTYPISLLRAQCPCAKCKQDRAEQEASKNRLRVIQGAHSDAPLAVVSAEKVGNYAIRLIWTDGHDTGIYSWHYLREISPQKKA